jgi:hypothetical protein
MSLVQVQQIVMVVLRLHLRYLFLKVMYVLTSIGVLVVALPVKSVLTIGLPGGVVSVAFFG